MPVSNSQAQGVVLALFGASAGGHLTSLAAASNLNTLAGDLAMSAGLILGRDISSNTAFRDHITSNLKLTGDALTAANAWLDGQLNAGAARGDMVATAVTFLSTLTDTTSPFFAAAQTFNTTVAAAVTWSTGAGATTFGVSALRAQQGNVEVVPGSSFVLTTGVDGFTGTAGNDTITGSSSTLAATDAIVDGSTTDNDTLNVSLTAANAAAAVVNIENVNFDWNAYGTASADLSAITGAKAINFTSSKVGFLGNLTIADALSQNIVAGAGMVGTITLTDAKTGVQLTADNAAAVSATTTRTLATGTVSSANAKTISVTDFANATVNSTFAGTSRVTVNVDDAGSVKNTTTVNVAAPTVTIGTNTYSGKLTINSTAPAAEITHTAGDIGDALVIGGTGNVTLVMDGDESGETITNAKTSGTLTLKTSATGTQDYSEIQADTIWATGVKATASVDTVKTGANLLYSATGGEISITVAGSGTTDTVTATLNGASQVLLANSGVETLNIVAAADQVTGTDMTITSLDTGGNNKIVFTGTNDIIISGVVDQAGNNAGTIDASALSGTLAITSTATNDKFTVSGGSGKLTLTSSATTADIAATGQSGADVITATAVTTGSLTAVLGDGNNTVSSGSALTTGTLVVISGSGNDTIGVSATSSVPGAALTTGVINLNLGDGTNTVFLDDAAGAGTRVVATGGGDDTVTFVGGLDNASDTLSWSAGAGTDTLYLYTEGADISTSTRVTLTDVEVIKIATETAAGDEAIFSAAQLSGKTYTIMAASYNAGNTFKVVGAATTTTIDLSKLTIDNTVTYGITGVVTDASANTTSSVTITGTALADTITGGSRADTISAGLGADTITGGAGNDTVTITESTASQSVDTVVLAAAGNGYDTIIGFKTGTDKITLGNAAETATAGAAEVEASGASVVVGTSGGVAVDLSVGIVTDQVDVIELSAALSSNGTLDNALDGTELLKAFSSTAFAATGFTLDADGQGFLLAYQNDAAYLYFYDAAGDTTVTASEISLVAKLVGITAGSLGNDFNEIA